MTALFDSIARIQNLGFFVGWFALVLLLAGALVYVWTFLHRRFAGDALLKHPAPKD